MLAHVRSFERNPRGSPDFLAYRVPKASLRPGPGTGVRGCLGVASCASIDMLSLHSLHSYAFISFKHVLFVYCCFDFCRCT